MGQELQDVFRMFGKEYCRHHRLPLNHLQAMTAVENCRSASLGGHVDQSLKIMLLLNGEIIGITISLR